MAYDLTLQGTAGNDNLFYYGANEVSVLVEALNGNDNVQLDTDLVDSSINLDGADDKLLITSTASASPTFRQSTIRGGDGADTIEVRTRSGADLQIWGDYGNDYIRLSSVKPGDNNASFVRTTVLGDNPVGANDGIDKVYIDDSVARFNYSLVNLNGNDNGIIAPVVNAVVDALANGKPLGLLDLGLEGMLVEAGEIYQSTFRGGSGSDWILFDSRFKGKAGATPLDTSVVNGNDGTDAIALLRDVDNSTIRGGKGDDYLAAASGTNRFALYNGNDGADTLLLGDILSQNSSYYGGLGNDVITVGSAVSTNSLFSGDKGDDDINFFSASSNSSTLLGGDGSDTIDDYSTAITSVGNVLDGGAGDDVLSQAANIIFSGVTDFGSTIIGGTGGDVMTGDSNTQPLGPKEYDGFEIAGASKDLFRFSFGDSVINKQGVGHDQITDFDSNASWYLDGTAANNPSNPFDYTVEGAVVGLDPLQRDVIDLTNGDIKIGASQTLPNGGGFVTVNNKGLVLSGVDNITEFVAAGSQQTTAGAAIVWTQSPAPFTTPAPFNTDEFRTSWLFISDGDGALSNGDLLVELTNVAFDTKAATGGMVINGGNITDFVAV